MKTAVLPDRISLAALALMLVLPFANPIHTAPIPSFYSEWLAAALALVTIAATLAGCAAKRPLAIPEIVALPLLLAMAALVHAVSGHAAHPRQALLTASTLILAGAMMVAGHSMAGTGGLERLAPWLARFLVAGSLLQCLVLGMQTVGIAVPWLVFLPLPGSVPTGTLGQANHLADYLWLGVTSAIYLMVRKGHISIPGSLLVLGFAVASTLPASRSVTLYPLGLALLAMLTWRATRNARPWRQVALLCLATLPLMLAADRLQVFRVGDASATAARSLTERLAASGGDRIRSGLYQVALEEGMARPLAGHGVGAAPWATFQRAENWPEGTTPVVAEHTHNIVLQWLLEYGLPLTLVALALLLRWLWVALSATVDANQWWALGLLTVIGIHSQLEYPLWLIYFLLPASWSMGAVTPLATTTTVLLERQHRAAIAGALLLGGTALVTVIGDYRQLEQMVGAVETFGSREQGIASAMKMERTSLLGANATLFVADAMGVSEAEANERWNYCEKALRISGKPALVTKCAEIAELAGHPNLDFPRRRLKLQ
jgi:O-antigen ligase